MKVKEMPESERPREKMLKYGVTSLSNAELIALVVRTGAHNASAMAIADHILALEDGGISAMSQLGYEEFCGVRGVGTATACVLTAAIELGKRIATTPKTQRISIEKPEAVSELFMEEMRNLKKETFKVLLLNTKNEILMIENVSVGNLNSSLATPREVFHNAIRRCASAIIVAHNHPSGNPTPSQCDLDLTLRLIEAGEILGIRVLDHIIIGDGVYVSLKREKLM